MLGPSCVEEIIILDHADEKERESVLNQLGKMVGVAEAELLECVGDKTFIRIVVTVSPHTGFCSDAVARNHGFRIGMEIQHGGIEHWEVGCIRASDAQQLIEDLKPMGEMKYHSISEVSWRVLLEGDHAQAPPD